MTVTTITILMREAENTQNSSLLNQVLMISGDAAAVDSLVSGGEGQTVISQYPQVTPPEAGVSAAQSVPEVCGL